MKTRNSIVLLALFATVTLAALPVTAAEYDIDTSHSAVTFQIKHLAISKVNGSFEDFSGTFTYDPANPGATQAEAVIQVTSVNTGNDKRDDHLRNPDFFDVAEFPTMTFKSSSVKMQDADQGQVTGDLTMHGVTKTVILDLEINGTATDPWGNERIGASLTGVIKRADWGLTYNAAMEAGGLVLGEDVKIAIELEGIMKK